MFKNKQDYMHFIEDSIVKRNKESHEFDLYLKKQFDLLDQLLEGISKENFWYRFPQVLGIDAKMSLIIELIKFEDFPYDEVIRIVEQDYRNYFKELCGFNLNSEINHSIIFHVK